jgi:DNA-binding HxlR family transcriptional regulator
VAKTIKGGAPCSIARTVDVLKDPWSFLILREALAGVTRFAEFRENLAIASDILTERLTSLVEHGIMAREPYREPGSRVRFSYRLTEAGEQLQVVIGALQQWGDDFLPHPGGPTIERTHRRTGRPLSVGFVDDRRRAVTSADVEFKRTAAYRS